jgi:hypothetical protein
MDEQTSGLTNDSPKAKPAEPKQQAQFDLLLGRCRQIMGEAADEWLATRAKEPVDGAVTLGTTTLRQMATMSEKAGQPVDPVVLIHVGIQLVKDVAAVANAAGLVSDEDLPGYLKDVMSQSMMEYLKADADDGLLSPEDKQRAQGVVDQAGPGMQQAMGPKAGAEPPMEPDAGMLARMQKGAPR